MTFEGKSSFPTGLWRERQEQHDQPPTLHLSTS